MREGIGIAAGKPERVKVLLDSQRIAYQLIGV